MTLDCDNISGGVVYNCSSLWGQGCTSSGGFYFPNLWNSTQNIQQGCPTDPRIIGIDGAPATPQNAALTLTACAAIVGGTWAYYSGADIWNRLTTWKFPLLQLVASFPRPPLSFWAEMFAVNHLLGDPIDTLKNLLTKMSTSQSRANHWKRQSQYQDLQGHNIADHSWTVPAIIEESYAEWSLQDQARQVLSRDRLRRSHIRIARMLAADRATKFLPIIVAELFFAASVGIAIFRTAAAADSSATSDTVFINVEAPSIAFSALYFWIIPSVFLSSIIGVSQTEGAIPRVLRVGHGKETGSLFHNINHSLDKDKRLYYGGIYSWQPSQWQSTSSSWIQKHLLLPYLIVLLGWATGLIISALVPPDGIDCRHVAQCSMLVIWLASAELDILFNKIFPLSKKENRARLFWCTYVKDLIATGSTMGCIIVTQVGIFNRCACYTQWGRTGLALPEQPDIAAILRARLGREYPAIVFSSIAIEGIIIPLAIWFWYKDAVRVYVQRDDGESSTIWPLTLLNH